MRLMVVDGGIVSFPARATFQDVLLKYLESSIGQAWFDSENEKPFHSRHQIAQWRLKADQFNIRKRKGDGERYEVEIEGVIGHYLALAHDVFSMKQSGLLRNRLIGRLLNSENFQGALYELQVAAICLRAGFDVTLSDETDVSTSHCEFTITFPSTGKAFSVEAKSRHRKGVLGRKGHQEPLPNIRPQITKHLESALAKTAEHERIVFIDLNIPPFQGTWQDSGLAENLIGQITALETKARETGMNLPSSLLVFTNRPAHYVADDAKAPPSAFLLTGFGMPEFRASQAGPSGPFGNSPDKWPELRALHKALKHQSDVPAAFNFDDSEA